MLPSLLRSVAEIASEAAEIDLEVAAAEDHKGAEETTWEEEEEEEGEGEGTEGSDRTSNNNKKECEEKM